MSATASVTKQASEPQVPTVLNLRPGADFVETPSVHAITERALAYIRAGFPVQFRGPAGAGKTTLALHVASRLGRPVVLLAGDDEFGTSDLTGGQFGYSYRRVVDNFIHTVRKTEEDMVQRWVDHRLSTACREGFTLVYDEFTRSRPEANNILLSVLEERILILPNSTRGAGYVKVHPDFTVLFTSNPEEYAGTHASQDALADRMVTIDLDFFDYETEVDVTAARSGLDKADAARIVGIVRDFRASGDYQQLPTLRACIMLANILANEGQRPTVDNAFFLQICLDVLGGKASFVAPSDERYSRQRKMIMNLIEHHCNGALPNSHVILTNGQAIDGQAANGRRPENILPVATNGQTATHPQPETVAQTAVAQTAVAHREPARRSRRRKAGQTAR